MKFSLRKSWQNQMSQERPISTRLTKLIGIMVAYFKCVRVLVITFPTNWGICARMLIATTPLILCGNTPVIRFGTL
jgi:hypothetical protein